MQRRQLLVPVLLFFTIPEAVTATPARAQPLESAPIASSDPRVHYALGLRARGNFVPGALLSLAATQYQPLSSYSLGLEFTRRKGPVDIVVSLDWSDYNMPDGNWLGAGKDPAKDTHFLQVRGLDFLSVDVSAVWNHDLTPWLAFMVGGGLGIGVVLGDINEINASSSLCKADNVGDTTKCYAQVNPAMYSGGAAARPQWTDASGKTQDLVGDIKLGDPNFQRKLDGTTAAQAACVTAMGRDCKDTAEHPYYHSTSDKPPVLVAVNVIVGFKIKVHRHASINISGGFRNGFFVGGGPEYVF